MPGWDYTDNWEYDWLDDESEAQKHAFYNAAGEYDEQEERIVFKKPGFIKNIKNYIIKVDNLSESINESYGYVKPAAMR